MALKHALGRARQRLAVAVGLHLFVNGKLDEMAVGHFLVNDAVGLGKPLLGIRQPLADVAAEEARRSPRGRPC